jgi:hypothetical protein
MAGRLKMFGRMLVLRAVAAADVAADKAHPQVDPCVPYFYAILADRYVLRVNVANLVFVRTGFLWHAIDYSRWAKFASNEPNMPAEASDSGLFQRT